MSAVAASTELLDDLVAGNRILFAHDIVDGFGHISARHPDDPQMFIMARYVAPGLVTRDDLREFTLESEGVIPGEKHYSERYIHGELYKARPDVSAIVHCHAAPLLPFGVTKTPLRPIYHMGAFLADGVPVFEIREAAGMTDMLIRTPALGAALAKTIGAGHMALMRGHGATFVGNSIRQVVYRAIYGTQNAISLLEALQLGDVTYLDPQEAALMEKHTGGVYNRPWEIWKAEALS